MRITTEKIRDYRNLSHVVFEPSPYVNVIYGENAQGKTNLIESIFLLTGAKSFRHGKDKDLIRKDGEGFSVIESDFYAEDRLQNIRLTISDKGRMASLNRAGERKASELVGKICCVVFSPDHLELVKGSPELRRRFMDTAMCQLSMRYYQDIKNYSRLLNQKNTLLKDARMISAAYDMLDVYDEQIAELAMGIIRSRREFCSVLNDHSSEAYGSVSSGKEKMSLSYVTQIREDTDEREEYLDLLRKARAQDLKLGFSSVGPHKDDISILLDGMDTRTYGSQGQQRTIVLSLKMAEAAMFREKIGEEPILLLDDVLSELDEKRQEYLLKKLGGSQAVITCCEPNVIEKQTDASVFRMCGGELEKA